MFNQNRLDYSLLEIFFLWIIEALKPESSIISKNPIKTIIIATAPKSLLSRNRAKKAILRNAATVTMIEDNEVHFNPDFIKPLIKT